jgi:pyrroloquinoline quinone (PQQ) biosynthesis protein C
MVTNVHTTEQTNGKTGRPAPTAASPKDLPALRRSTTVILQDAKQGGVILRRNRDEVTLEGAGAQLFRKMQPLLDGQTTIEAIAQKLGEKPARVRALSEELVKVGVLAFLSAKDGGALTTGMEFYQLHRELCQYWLEDVYRHPFWDKVTSGKATRAQVIGFAFEKYHYIEAAFEHMGIAAANSTPEMMPHLARHFIEEYTHGDIYRKGLRSLFPDQLILHSQPLPSTRALVNYLRESAQRSSFAYYSGNELLQMTENTGEETAGKAVDDFYGSMRKHYPYTGPLIDSFIAHTKADQKLGHADAFLLMCQSVPPLTQREVNDALNVAKNMAEHLVLFMDGIDTFYEHFATVPRLPCDSRSE